MLILVVRPYEGRLKIPGPSKEINLLPLSHFIEL